jgi:epoxyqueuosine reductase
MKDLTSKIKALGKREGVSLIGIVSAKGWEEVAEGRRPIDILPDAESVVVMAIQILDKAIDGETPPKERQSVRRAIDNELDRVGAEITQVLTENGFKGQTAVSPIYKTGYLDVVNGKDELGGPAIMNPIHENSESPATPKRSSPDWGYLQGSIPLKYAAQKAGLGTIGKSSLLITPQYGPRVRLLAIVTNAPLVSGKPLKQDLCGKCSVCEKVCIAKAFHEGRHDIEMCWRAEMELGEPVPGTTYKLCPAPCLKLCPVGKLKEKYRVA